MISGWTGLGGNRKIGINVVLNKTVTPRDGDLVFLEGYLSRALPNFLELRDTDPDDAVADLVLDVGFLGMPSAVAENDARSGANAMVLPIRISYTNVLVGPVFRVEDQVFTSPCIRCLESRWLALRSAELQLVLSREKGEVIASGSPVWTPFSAESVLTLALAVLRGSTTGEPSVRRDTIYALVLETLSVSTYDLVAVPTCEACGRMLDDTPEAAALRFKPRRKQAPNNYRLVAASSYDMPVKELVNPVCGVLGAEFGRDYSNTVTSPVTGRFFVRSKYSVHPAWWSGHALSYQSSLTVGLLEGLERYSGLIPRAKRTTVFESYEDLDSDALDPRMCGLYSPEFYDAHRNYIPFEPDRKLHWVWGYSFQKGAPILVPEQMVYYLDYRAYPPNFVQECSNGCATGSCMEEATLFGLLELLERDSFLISWFARLPLRRIDPWSCSNAETLCILDRIGQIGYDVFLFDMRLDFPIPAVLGLARRREPGLGRLVFAAGASLDPEAAVRAALDEVASYVPGFVDRVKSNLENLKPMVNDFSKVKNLEDHSLLYGLPEMEDHAEFLFDSEHASDLDTVYQEYRLEQPKSLELVDDLDYCMDLFLGRGMDVIVVDQTCLEQTRLGIRTACVIVPGLLPMYFGWDRHRLWNLPRLRTVPQEAGYLDAPYEPFFPGIPPHPFP